MRLVGWNEDVLLVAQGESKLSLLHFDVESQSFRTLSYFQFPEQKSKVMIEKKNLSLSS